MHDTVAKVLKRIRSGPPWENIGELFSARMQEAGVSRALADPLSGHLELLYLEAFRWIQLTDAAIQEDDAATLTELVHSCRHLHLVLQDVLPFLERVEDSLGEREDITHHESGYEREVAPFSRLESTRTFREFLAAMPGGNPEVAGTGAQAMADLLKVVHLELRIRDESPKPADLYALVVEMLLDGRRHLLSTFADDSKFLAALKTAARTAAG